MDEGTKRFDSFDELRRDVREILERINADEQLALAAAANPVLALQEIGYEISDEVERDLERRARFDRDERSRLAELEAEVFRHAGRPFDIGAADELETVLFEELRIPRPQRNPSAEQQGREHKEKRERGPKAAPRVPNVGWGPRVPDPLEELADAHPVMGPLLEYRALEARHPRFAPRPLYERVRRGEAGVTLRLRARLKDQPG